MRASISTVFEYVRGFASGKGYEQMLLSFSRMHAGLLVVRGARLNFRKRAGVSRYLEVRESISKVFAYVRGFASGKGCEQVLRSFFAYARGFASGKRFAVIFSRTRRCF